MTLPAGAPRLYRFYFVHDVGFEDVALLDVVEALESDTALEALRDTEAPAREKNGLLKSCIKRIDYSRKRINGGHKQSSDPDSPICMKYTLNI